MAPVYSNDSEDEARLREPGPEMGSPSGGSRVCLERPQTFSELWARVSSAQSPEPRAVTARVGGLGAPRARAWRLCRAELLLEGPGPQVGEGVHRPGQGGVILAFRVGQD